MRTPKNSSYLRNTNTEPPAMKQFSVIPGSEIRGFSWNMVWKVFPLRSLPQADVSSKFLTTLALSSSSLCSPSCKTQLWTQACPSQGSFCSFLLESGKSGPSRWCGRSTWAHSTLVPSWKDTQLAHIFECSLCSPRTDSWRPFHFPWDLHREIRLSWKMNN